jgi:hypothetical protein
MLLRIVFLSALISVPAYSSQPAASQAQRAAFVYWWEDFTYVPDANKPDRRVAYGEGTQQAILRAATVAQGYEKLGLEKEKNEIARARVQAVQTQNQLLAQLVTLLALNQSHAPAIRPVAPLAIASASTSTAAAPAPSAPPAAAVFANTMQPNQMPPDHKSSTN